jgi:hypothetical protein
MSLTSASKLNVESNSSIIFVTASFAFQLELIHQAARLVIASNRFPSKSRGRPHPGELHAQ